MLINAEALHHKIQSAKEEWPLDDDDYVSSQPYKEEAKTNTYGIFSDLDE